MNYLKMNRRGLETEYAVLKDEFKKLKNMNLSLNMARGKPSPEQLSLSNSMFSNITDDFISSNIDIRNYGYLEGLPEARKLMGDLLGCPSENVIVGGNSSLSLMHDVVANFFIKGSNGCPPWKTKKIKFLCPSPGYDRHFQICEFFGIEMINIRMNSEGPDIETIKKLVSNDDSIKAIWCVPKYSNPDGIVYSDNVIKELANLKPAAKDFKILWDNAYCVHDLYDFIPISNIFDECKKAGNESFPIAFCSTSKITFAAGGISAIGCLGQNYKDMKLYFSRKLVSFDKINQYRHVKFLKNLENIKSHMLKHASILRPKFEFIISEFEKNFGENKILKWMSPKGGYFISVYSYGSAKKIESLCKELGLSITPAGATYPNGIDPDDNNIRIAPSYPSMEELQKAMKVFCVCVRMAAIEKLLDEAWKKIK